MKYRAPHRGYSLLEMVVAVGLFSVVMLVITGAYLTLIDLDRKARATNDLVASLSFAVENIARNLRTGRDYACWSTGGNGTCNRITFTDSQSQTVTYLLKSDATIGQCTGGSCSDATAIALTDAHIDIDALTFYVRGVGPGDGLEPQVTISVHGGITTASGEVSDFTLQSGATQRYIEL